MLEDKKDSVDDRLKMTTYKLDAANTTLENAEGGKEALETRHENTSDKLEELEKQVAAAKLEAQEADRRCEDIVRWVQKM